MSKIKRYLGLATSLIKALAAMDAVGIACACLAIVQEAAESMTAKQAWEFGEAHPEIHRYLASKRG